MHLWWPELLFAVINYFQTMPGTNLNTGTEEFCGEGEMKQKRFGVHHAISKREQSEQPGKYMAHV